MKLKLLSSLLIGSLALATTQASAKGFDASHPPKDPGVINKERILYWLTKRGELAEDASLAEKEAAFAQYAARASGPSLPKIIIEGQERTLKTSNKTLKADKTVKVLAIMIDFPDLKHNNNRLSSGDTDMYYSSYPVSHYQDLMFSTNGFAGPSGQTLTSGYQYYQAESGQSFYFTGESFGWVTADNDHSYYGAHDGDDKDKNVPALIQEAVAKAVAANSINLAEYDIEDPYDRDGDNNTDEADGFIDHVMVYHSSIGEEAGGGVADNNGDDAIWSHRFFVNQTGNFGTMGYLVPGTDKRLFGYTIQPIDAATGVVVHEFGHDLGVPDEYDTGDSNKGSPVGIWSVMSAGSWAGNLSGSKPTGFSPYARSYFQNRYGGNWINEQVIKFEDLTGSATVVDLVEAIKHDSGINQIKVEIPAPQLEFYPPYTGSYQYYSGKGDMKNNSMSFDVQMPTGTDLKLNMKAHWNIEVDYDYVQVLVNNTVVAGNHTKATNQYHASVKDFISNKSTLVTGAEGALGWVDLIFDVTAYSGQNVTIKFQYITDQNTGDYGFVADDISITNSGTQAFFDGAESESGMSFDGFSKASSTADGLPQNYWIQLRSENDMDAGFGESYYTPGVVVWFADENYSDNKSSEHAGHGFIGVVDADQNLIGTNSSTTQVQDAAFGLYTQKSRAGDNSLTPSDTFDDATDYSSPSQPESGMVLPTHGLKMVVTQQAVDSTTAKLEFFAPSSVLTADFGYAINFRSVTFTDSTAGGDETYTYAWDFGDGNTSTQASPSHDYAASGTYAVELTVTDGEATVSSETQNVTIAEEMMISFDEQVSNDTISVQSSVTGGAAGFTYSWNFGDGSAAVSSQNANHTYATSGDYTIELTVTSADGQQAVVSRSVSISIALVGGFTSTVNNLAVNFTNSSAGGTGALTYAWNFGDGSNSTSRSPSHTYAESGTYSVTMVVTDGLGASESTTRSVTVKKKKSGGGSFGLLSLLLLAGLGLKRRK